ncbi:MAG: DUF5606 domain-containing protein [Flavobacteriales bacterium]|nr:DUF5606 domain-containing protein [Flavobacteriales bacterium]
METKTSLSKIISIGGKSGLYKVLNTTSSVIIAESLVDGKRGPVHHTQRVSSLSDISIFTTDEDMPLQEVLEKMKTHYEGNAAPPLKDAAALRKEILKFLPEYDKERVYDNDLKKLFLWYNLLQAKNMLDFEQPEE